jgi:hypothetical protein
MKRLLMPAFLILIIILTACSAPSNPPPAPTAAQDNPQPAPVTNVIPTPTDDPAILATLFPNMGSNVELTRMDQQGAVIMEVTPLNLGTPAETLDFDVVLNTHSVDLGMDLAALSTLTTDTGIKVEATSWDAPRGGHHVSGKLVFPAMQDGKSVLEGSKKITLTILNLEAPSRIFEWELK